MLPRILVVCEGETEKRCLEELRGYWRIPSVQVEVIGQGGVPKTVVQRAKERSVGYGRRKGDAPEVWVAFDRDEHESWAAALDRARAPKFKLAVSNPCFELWGLLLHRDQTAWIHRHVAQRELARVHPGYHHDDRPYLDLPTVLGLLDEAHRRAEQIGQQARREDEPCKNPTTRFHLLVARIGELK